VIKSISFIVLTQFFHFSELKILRQPGYFIFFKLNQQYFCTVLFDYFLIFIVDLLIIRYDYFQFLIIEQFDLPLCMKYK